MYSINQYSFFLTKTYITVMLLKGTHLNTCNTVEFRDKRCIPMRVYFGNPCVCFYVFVTSEVYMAYAKP